MDQQEPTTAEPDAIAAESWQRYLYGIERGHREYTEIARMLEGFYLGGDYDKDGNLQAGGQWNEGDLGVLEEQRRPAYEFNQIKPAVDAALGYQIANRMDISFRPRSGDATREVAEVRSKVAMQIADNNKLHWKETEVFGDGMIQQRGFFECRMGFDDSIFGELQISVLDPMDVMPDPDAKSYHPSTWADVIVARWLTADEIEGMYGAEARNKAENAAKGYDSRDFGGDGDGAERGSFGSMRYWALYAEAGTTRIRVIDRQKYVRTRMNVAVYPGGDVRPLNGGESPEFLAGLHERGAHIARRMVRRVRWTVSTCDTLLHDDWSPYDRFTVVPYFPYFRRGKTRGMVDNAVGPQKSLNKGVSQAIHIINTTANSGWQVEEGQLTNMSTSDLENVGATTGIVLERKAGSQPLQKIMPNGMPGGIDHIIQMSNQVIQDVTVPNAMRGITGAGESGIAIQSRQHASQQLLSVPLDNLARTRNMLADWIDYGITRYYDTERVFRITRQNPMTGMEEEQRLVVNQFDPATGSYLNDMTAGEYDTVVTEQPMQITFENSQFRQVMEMRNASIRSLSAAGSFSQSSCFSGAFRIGTERVPTPASGAAGCALAAAALRRIAPSLRVSGPVPSDAAPP
jgi:hypothetical protein